MREVPREVAAAFAEESGLLFFETSAKTGAGVGEVFTEIGKRHPFSALRRTDGLTPCEVLTPLLPSTAKKIPLDTLAGAGRAGAAAKPAAGATAASGAADRVKLGEDVKTKEACAC